MSQRRASAFLLLAGLFADAGEARAEESPVRVTLVERRGAGIQSDDGAYELRIRALLQTDLRVFVNDEHKHTDQFVVRRARVFVEGKATHIVTFRVMPDFVDGRAILFDAWFDVRASDGLRLRVGKSKPPFALERLQNAAATTFAERAYPTALSPNRDLGVELRGDLFRGVIAYGIGVFNGVPDSGISEGDIDDSKELAARVEAGPFARTSTSALRGLRLGFAITRGEKTGTPTSTYLAGYRTFGQEQLFSYTVDPAPAAPTAAGTTAAKGLHARSTASLYWPIGPLAVIGEVVTTQERVARGGQSRLLRNTGWNATASLLVTGEDAAFDGPVPIRPFDLARGHFGALELAARATELHVDPHTFPQYADSARSARDAFEVAAGINWYPTAQLKIVANFARTTFHAGAPQNAARDAENAFIFRTQLAF